jgi:hypothetical protein
MTNHNNRYRISVLLLALATFLALAKPAAHLLLKPNQGTAYGLDWDYGVPRQWYGNPAGGRPAGVKLPENSIGLDFLSFDTYVRCAGLGPEMYESRCAGDPFERPFAYPPLLTAAFFWIPFVSTQTAVAVWSLAVMALILMSVLLWGYLPINPERSEPGHRIWTFAFFLLISYPAVFAFERGNTEAIILIALSVAAWALVLRRWFWVGFVTALAAIAKMYPLLTWTACGLLAFALLISSRERKSGILILAGSAAGFLIPLAVMAPQHIKYFSSVLPFYSKLKMPSSECSFCHSWPQAYDLLGYGLATILGGVAVLHFVFYARRFALKNDKGELTRCLMSLAYGMGIAVYVPDMSYDYSLIMLFPLFILCVLRDVSAKINMRGIGVTVLLVASTLPRWLEGLAWSMADHSLFLIGQTLGMLLIGFSLAGDVLRSYSSAAVRSGLRNQG